MIFHIWISIITEMISILGTTVATLIMRWLLNVSTPEKDRRWLISHGWYREVEKLKFYRGFEYAHQVRARRVYSSSNS